MDAPRAMRSRVVWTPALSGLSVSRPFSALRSSFHHQKRNSSWMGTETRMINQKSLCRGWGVGGGRRKVQV